MGYRLFVVDLNVGFWIMAVVGVIAKTLTVFVSGFVWVRWVGFLANHPAKMREGLFVYSKANIGKYLPGNVMQYVGRNLYATRLGIPQTRLATGSLIEIVSLVLVALFTSAVVAHGQLREAVSEVCAQLELPLAKVLCFFLIGTLCATLAFFLVFRGKLHAALSVYSFKSFVWHLGCGMLCQAIVLITLGLLFLGIYATQATNPSVGVGTGIVAGYVIAWVLGFIVPGAPGGIGIREMVLMLLVGSVIGRDQVVSIAVVHRLITIIGDVFAYFVGLAIRHRTKQ